MWCSPTLEGAPSKLRLGGDFDFDRIALDSTEDERTGILQPSRRAFSTVPSSGENPRPSRAWTEHPRELKYGHVALATRQLAILHLRPETLRPDTRMRAPRENQN
jgi:hypothetical protein